LESLSHNNLIISYATLKKKEEELNNRERLLNAREKEIERRELEEKERRALLPLNNKENNI